jgi:hypothetical protein
MGKWNQKGAIMGGFLSPPAPRTSKREEEEEVVESPGASAPLAMPVPSSESPHEVDKVPVLAQSSSKGSRMGEEEQQIAKESGLHALSLASETGLTENLGGTVELLTGFIEGRDEVHDARSEMKEAKGKTKAEKAKTGLQVAGTATSVTEKATGGIGGLSGMSESASGVLGDVAGVAGQMGGALGAVQGAVDIGTGVNQVRKATKNKKGLRNDLAHNDANLALNSWLGGDAFLDGDSRLDAMNEHAALMHMTEQQSKAQKEGAFKTATGALDVASGVATATGVGAAVGGTIGLVSTGAKVGKKAADYGVQKGRDSKSATRKDLLTRQAVGKLAENRNEKFKERGEEAADITVTGISNKEQKKLDKQSKQQSRHKKSVRGQSLGVMDSARDATTLNTDASKENQAANKANTAEMVLKSSGDKQLEYLGYMGINEAAWKKMQAKAAEHEDPQQQLKDMLIAGQINI